MDGELPSLVVIGSTGFEGDRAYAIVDTETGKVASAKDPRRWAGLFAYTARYVDDTRRGAPIVIELPDGTTARSDAPDVNDRLSDALGRTVTLASHDMTHLTYDDVWPDVDGTAPADVIAATQTGVTEDGLAVSTLGLGGLAPGTYQDLAPITLMTSASIATMAQLQPSTAWDQRRFRSNLVIDCDGDGFVEDEWSGRQLHIGDTVLDVMMPTPRCIMTTLGQRDLPADREVLRSLAQHHRVGILRSDGGERPGLFACLGAYATVREPGRISVGDDVRLL